MRKSYVQINTCSEKDVQAYATEHGLAFATAIRCIVEEYLTIQKIIRLTPEQQKQVSEARLRVS